MTSLITITAAMLLTGATAPMEGSQPAILQAAAPVEDAALFLDPPPHAPAYGRRDRDARRIYDDRGRYLEPRRMTRDDRIWRGRDGNYYCERDNGTVGLVIGAGLGALAGRAIDTRGDRTLGTVLGAIAGGLVGREIDRGELRCH